MSNTLKKNPTCVILNPGNFFRLKLNFVDLHQIDNSLSFLMKILMCMISLVVRSWEKCFIPVVYNGSK